MGSIDTSLRLICRRLDEYFQNIDRRVSEPWVSLSNIVGPTGDSFKDAENKIVMFLANIGRDTTISTFNRSVPTGGDSYAAVTPPVYVVLHVLFYANFYDGNYREGLWAISNTISFFQQNPYFTQDNLPGLPREIDKLAFDLVHLDPTDTERIMTLAAVNYLPSAYYRIRLIPFRSDTMVAEVPAARGVEAPGSPSPPIVHEDGRAAAETEEVL